MWRKEICSIKMWCLLTPVRVLYTLHCKEWKILYLCPQIRATKTTPSVGLHKHNNNSIDWIQILLPPDRHWEKRVMSYRLFPTHKHQSAQLLVTQQYIYIFLFTDQNLTILLYFDIRICSCIIMRLYRFAFNLRHKGFNLFMGRHSGPWVKYKDVQALQTGFSPSAQSMDS